MRPEADGAGLRAVDALLNPTLPACIRDERLAVDPGGKSSLRQFRGDFADDRFDPAIYEREKRQMAACCSRLRRCP